MHPHLGAGTINRWPCIKLNTDTDKWWLASMVEYYHVLHREEIGERSALDGNLWSQFANVQDEGAAFGTESTLQLRNA